MIYIAPSTELKFLRGIPFDPDYENTMYFDSKEQQYSYMQSHVVYALYNYTYQRKDRGVIRVGWIMGQSTPGPIMEYLYNANYMMFKNDNFENKWFYAFVDKVEYVNNNTCDVYYHIDVIQTWHFDYSFNQCLIERQHPPTDTPGANTVPENLETGEYMLEGVNTFSLPLAIFVELASDGTGTYQSGGIMGGRLAGSSIISERAESATFSGHRYYKYELSEVANLNTDLESLKEKIDAVISIFMAPSYFWPDPNTGLMPNPIQYVYGRQPTINGYTPRNKKLHTWPYTALYANNFQGQSVVMPFEYFTDPLHATVNLWGSFVGTPGLIFWPSNYKGTTDNFEESLIVNGFPICSWSYDTYKAWLAQNAGYLGASAVSVMENAIGAFIPGYETPIEQKSPISKAKYPTLEYKEEESSFSSSGFLGQAFHLLGSVRDHSVMPPTSGANASGSVLNQAGLLNVMVGRKSIRREYLEIIDAYFDMYGYKSNRVSIPNRNARPCYTYVKTVGCSIDGNLPNNDIVELQNIYNRGIRFWKPTAVFGSFDPSVNDNRV